MSTNQENRSIHRGHSGRRRLLLGCGIALALLLVLAGAAWWLVSRHLGSLLSGVVREQAAEAINGRLEFAKLDVDLAGRAVLTDATVYPADSETPWITCPRTVVGFDLFNLIGPNRGKQAITVSLQQPTVILEREPDGRFNLARLIKKREQERKPLGLAISVRDAKVDFSDWCLLDQGYPQLAAGDGLGARLLEELGYDPQGGAEIAVHREMLVVNGTAAINQERKELSLNARVKREEQGGTIAATGTALLDGTTFDIRLVVEDAELATGGSYLHALFPRLMLGSLGGSEPAQMHKPELSGRLSHAQLRLQKRPSADVSLSGKTELADLAFISDTLPQLDMPRLQLDLSTASGKLNADLLLNTLDCIVQGNITLNTSEQKLDGKLAVNCPEPAKLAAWFEAGDLPIQGAVNAQVTLAGSPAEPQLTAQLGSEFLSYEQLKLGKLSGTAKLAGPVLGLEAVKLGGGEAQLTASGSYDLKAANGHFEVRVGPLPATQVLDLAARVRPEASPPEVELAGSLSAAVELTIASSKAQMALRTWSDSLTIAGQRFDDLDVKCQLSPPNVKIEEAVARYVGAEPFRLGSFHSSSPLAINLRASGSISTVPGQQQPALAIVGEGDTTNLNPSQAHISFKALGPADDPELRLQIKTTHALAPLVFNAQGHYRQGYAPATATLSWHETKASFDGRVDLSKQLVDGQIQASEVDLRRFSGNQRLSGSLSMAGTVGGSFSEPSLGGSLTIPRMSVETDWRQYSVHDATADFELVEGNAISVSSGSFAFEENQFTISGRLGQQGSRLSLTCADFNLLSALAMVRPQDPQGGSKTAPTRPSLDIKSSGPLTVAVTGDLSDPLAKVNYTSGPGHVEGYLFDSAELKASASLQNASIENFAIRSADGKITLNTDPTAPITYNPLAYSVDIEVKNFNIGLLTPLIDSKYLTGLAGTVNGAVKLRGGADAYSADGRLAMRDGQFNGLAISEASATFTTSRGTTRITDGLIVADGRVTLSAELHHQATSYAIAAQFQRFNINAFLPLVDIDLLEGAGGRLDGTLEVASSNREYNIDGDLQLRDGRFQGVAVSEASASVKARGGRIDITDAKVVAEGTQLTGWAKIGTSLADMEIHVPSPQGQPGTLNLALVSSLLPGDVPPLSGKLVITKFDLVPGSGKYPAVELNAHSTEGQVGAGSIRFDSIRANLSIENNTLKLREPLELHAGQSSLVIKAKQIKLADIQSRQAGQALPLDFSLSCTDFDLDDVAELLPVNIRRMVPGGVFTCENLIVGGTTANPSINGILTFDITRMPTILPSLALVSRASGRIKFTPGEIEVLRLSLTPAGGLAGSDAVVSGSGKYYQLYPFRLKSGQVDLILAEQGQYIFVNTNEIDPSLMGVEGGAQAQLPLNFAGWVGGTVHIKAPPEDAADKRPVIGGQLTINTEGQTSEVEMLKPRKEEAERTPAAFRFDARDGLRIEVKAGTKFIYDRGSAPGNLDLRAELAGIVTLRGVPGLLNPADPDALRIEGTLEMPEGSMKLYRHVVRLDSNSSRLKFMNLPGDMYPYLTARASLELPRVLTGGETYTSTGIGANGTGARSERGDLKIFFTLSNHKLDPTSDPVNAVQLSSEPSLPTEQIVSYLLGDAGSVLTGTGSLSQFAQGELQAFGASFISRYIEDQLNLSAFQVGGTGKEENPYYMDVEKELTPGFSVTYYRDFFSQSYQAEEYGVKYRILDSGNNYSNVDLELNFTKGGFRGTGSEFMFTWSTRF